MLTDYPEWVHKLYGKTCTGQRTIRRRKPRVSADPYGILPVEVKQQHAVPSRGFYPATANTKRTFIRGAIESQLSVLRAAAFL